MGAGIWWLVSFPKSGNTWLRAIIATLVSGRPANINRLMFLGFNSGGRLAFDNALGIDSVSLTYEQETNLRPRAYGIWAAEATRPLYCKAHDAYHLTPSGEPLFPAAATRGAVYIVRDPRAVAVSSAPFMALSIDQVIANMANPEAVSGATTARLSQLFGQRLLRWCDHVESWLAAPFPVHFLRYENLVADPIATIAAVAAFLGLPCDRQTIAMVAEATHFSRLQAQEREAGFIEKPLRAAAFFREGRVEGWRQVLTPEQAQRIVATHGAVMRRLNYDVTLEVFAAPKVAAAERSCQPLL